MYDNVLKKLPWKRLHANGHGARLPRHAQLPRLSSTIGQKRNDEMVAPNKTRQQYRVPTFALHFTRSHVGKLHAALLIA
jgi:hypothetical protein